VGKLIGYARVSTRQQRADRQTTDLLAAGIRRDGLYVDHGVSGARASRPAFDEALRALHEGDALVITTLVRFGRSTQSMLALAEDLRGRGASLRVLNLGGGDADTATPTGSMAFAVMEALAQMELEITRERITDSVSERRAAGKDLGGRRQSFTDSQVKNTARLIDAGEPAAQVARDMSMSRATLAGDFGSSREPRQRPRSRAERAADVSRQAPLPRASHRTGLLRRMAAAGHSGVSAADDVRGAVPW
jgi:DNA invertase Pin-like site-specific DNA recombinase